MSDAICRLGFLVDFLSHATIVGFMAGAATVVCLQQLKGILGLSHFTHETDVISVMHSVFGQIHEVFFTALYSCHLTYRYVTINTCFGPNFWHETAVYNYSTKHLSVSSICLSYDHRRIDTENKVPTQQSLFQHLG